MNEELERIKSNPEMLIRYMATKRFINFARYIYPKLEITPFHRAYYEVLDKFAHGSIRKLIVSCPPQAGKSTGSSRLLPAFLLGLNRGVIGLLVGMILAVVFNVFKKDKKKLILMNSRDKLMLFRKPLI